MKKLLGIITAITVAGTSMFPLCAAAASPKATAPQAPADSVSVTNKSYNWKNVAINGGGYVTGIEYSKAEKNLIYARTDMGGAYKWDNASKSWKCITDSIGRDDWNWNGCDSLATDPSDANRVYIEAGTYDNGWGGNGAVLRSDDKGSTWKITELPFACGSNMSGRTFGERLVVDPNCDSVLYMGTRGHGLFESTDYGATWNKASGFPCVGDYTMSSESDWYKANDNHPLGVLWIAPDSTSSAAGTACKTLYAGIANNVGEETIYVTTDGGATWNAVSGQPTTSFLRPSETLARPRLPAHGVLASNGVLYVNYTDSANVYSAQKGDVWKYDTKTSVWTDISPVDPKSSDNYFGYGGLSVDAANPDTLVVSTDEQWWPDANFYRSTDGGKTWVPFWEWAGYPTRKYRYTLDVSTSPWYAGTSKDGVESATKLGWMIGNLSIDPFDSDRMMYGTGAGLFCADDMTKIDSGGKCAIYDDSVGIEQTVGTVVISPPAGTAHLISGLGDLCGFVHTDLDTVPQSEMKSPQFSTTTGMDYAERNPSKMVRVGSYSNATSDSRIGISYDTGKDWYTVNDCWTTSSSDATEGGNVAMSADGNTIVWAPKDVAPHYSTDTGSSWTACTGLPSNAVVASDRVNPKNFYAISNGTFFLSTDGGATFSKTTDTFPAATQYNVKAVPGSEGDIWVSGGTSDDLGLWHSTDSGKTFTRISGVGAETIGFGKAADGQTCMALYTEAKINGSFGVFRSDDYAKTWVKISSEDKKYGLDNQSITGDPRIFGRCYLGTNGRGILYGDISQNSSSIDPSAASFDKNTSKQADIKVAVTLNGNTLGGIYNGDTALVKDTDYTVNDDGTLTILKSYLAKQDVGTLKLTFKFSAGEDCTLNVSVTDTSPSSVISPKEASFDKNTAKAADINVTLTLNGNTLLGVYNGDTALVKGTDYTVNDDGTLTILKSYLAKQDVGTLKLMFKFSAGESSTLEITVADSTPSSVVSPKTASFDKNVANAADINVTLTLNGNTLLGVYNGDTALVKGTDYTVNDDGTLTILKSYLAKQPVGALKLTFKFSAGESSTLEITVADSTPAANSSISPAKASFDKNAANAADVTVTINLNGNTLLGIYNGDTALVKGTDYTVNDDGTLTILKSYLAKQKIGTLNLTFIFSAGESSTLEIAVADSTPVAPCTLKLQMFTSNTQSSSAGIMPRYRIINLGDTAVDLSKVKIHYYFTEDGTQPENFWCDWSSVGSSNITSSFIPVQPAAKGADTCLEIGFTSGAGTLAPGADVYVQARFSKNDWSSYDQTNDYSFDPKNTDYQDFSKSTLYFGDTLKWGVEPS